MFDVLGSDIDAVCLLPKFVDRHRLFDSLPVALQADDNISNLRKVTEAYVPIISFEYQRIQVSPQFYNMIALCGAKTIEPNMLNVLKKDNSKYHLKGIFFCLSCMFQLFLFIH